VDRYEAHRAAGGFGREFRTSLERHMERRAAHTGDAGVLGVTVAIRRTRAAAPTG